NGDGLPDLLVRQETNTLALYFNTGKPDRLYGRDPDVVIPVKLDNAATFDGLALDDLNSDGASDLILYRGNYDDVLAAYISRRQ
ncbi:MAG: hypothetical protein FJ291_31830, partial [Planctomycetes bacterium]|nr:hypothetical protein [Planctomycetota bacterium]